ncbi:MAG: hypothetical protein ACRCWJ_02065 [Casimicrobium sp.]
MTPGERVAMAAQIGFFGTLATGSSIHSAKNTHAAIKGTTQTSTPPTKTTTSNPRAETSGTTTKSDAVTPRNNESATDFAERAGIPRSTERSTLDAAERAGLVMSSEGNSQPLLEGSHNLDVVDTPPGVTRSGKPRPGNTRNVDDWGPRQVTIGQAQKLALDNIAANQRTYSAADLSRLTHIFKGGYVVRVMQQDSSAPHAMHKETAAAVVTPNFNGKTKESGVAYLSNVYTQLPGGGEMATKRALEISKTLNQELVGYTTGVKARDLYIDLGARIESVEPHYKKIRAAVTEDPSLTTKIDPRIRDILRSGVNPQGQLTELARTNPEPFFDLPDECASYHFRFGRQPLLEGSGNSNVVVTSPKPGSNGDLRPVNTRNVDQWVPGQLTDGQAKQLASDNIAANPRSYSAEDLKRLTEIFKGGHVVRITQKGVDAPHGAPLRETAAAVVTPNFNGSAKQDGVAYLSNVYTQLPGAGEMATVKAIETAKSLRQDLVGYTTGPQARDLYIKLGAQIESVVPRYEKIRESLVNDPAVAATIDPSIKQIIEHGTEPEHQLEALAKSNPAIFFNLPEGAVSYYFRFGTGQHASGSVGAARNGFLNESNAPQQPSVIELPKPLPKLSAQDSLQLRALATTPENQALIDELLLQKNIGSGLPSSPITEQPYNDTRSLSQPSSVGMLQTNTPETVIPEIGRSVEYPTVSSPQFSELKDGMISDSTLTRTLAFDTVSTGAHNFAKQVGKQWFDSVTVPLEINRSVSEVSIRPNAQFNGVPVFDTAGQSTTFSEIFPEISKQDTSPNFFESTKNQAQQKWLENVAAPFEIWKGESAADASAFQFDAPVTPQTEQSIGKAGTQTSLFQDQSRELFASTGSPAAFPPSSNELINPKFEIKVPNLLPNNPLAPKSTSYQIEGLPGYFERPADFNVFTDTVGGRAASASLKKVAEVGANANKVGAQIVNVGSKVTLALAAPGIIDVSLYGVNVTPNSKYSKSLYNLKDSAAVVQFSAKHLPIGFSVYGDPNVVARIAWLPGQDLEGKGLPRLDTTADGKLTRVMATSLVRTGEIGFGATVGGPNLNFTTQYSWTPFSFGGNPAKANIARTDDNLALSIGALMSKGVGQSTQISGVTVGPLKAIDPRIIGPFDVVGEVTTDPSLVKKGAPFLDQSFGRGVVGGTQNAFSKTSVLSLNPAFKGDWNVTNWLQELGEPLSTEQFDSTTFDKWDDEKGK